MAINLGPAEGVAPPTTGRLDRHDAEARQARWILEVERAMLSARGKPQRCAAAREHGEAGPQRDASWPKNGAEAPVAAPHRPVSAVSGASVGTHLANGPQSGVGSAEPARHVQANDGSLNQGDVMGKREGDAAHVVAVAQLPGHVVTSGWISSTASVAGNRMAAFAPEANGASLRAPNLALARDVEKATNFQTTQAVQHAATVPLAAFGSSAEPLPDSSLPAGVGLELTAQPDSGATTTAGLCEFDKRLIHLFFGVDGMHAYIRDAELGADQMHSVAAALRTELAASGQSLAMLTVNGKRISLTSKDASGPAFGAEDAPLAVSDEPAGERSYFQSLTPVRKEPSE